ncbi:MAG: hypothetical protein JWO20_3361 [Candidatus Angelobacter sp.]|nr:hypothetical protein [Candidatus Angelobacter sp.]
MIRPRQAFFSLVLFVAWQAAGAQEASCQPDPKRHNFRDWIKTVGLDYGKQYTASASRRKQILENYDKVKTGMSRPEIEKLLGSPDVEERFRSPKVYAQPNPDAVKQLCGHQWVYLLSKLDVEIADMKDEGIYLSFDDDGKLTWASPLNVKGLKQKGFPQ